jgi:hypothetical protein
MTWQRELAKRKGAGVVSSGLLQVIAPQVGLEPTEHELLML